ncbi:MAG: alkaline phosphatase D family protein [Roseobacter sp.]
MHTKPLAISEPLGPVLIVDDIRHGQIHLAVLVVAPKGHDVPPLVFDGDAFEFLPLAVFDDLTVCRARFTAPAKGAFHYSFAGEDYPVCTSFDGDMRLGFASCNGEEHGDLDRDNAERNVMWSRLRKEHEEAPFALLLHGGDQIYADEATKGHALSDDWPNSVPKDPLQSDLHDLDDHLRREFMRRYLAMLQCPDYGWLVARVPSLSQWDDHDICDGWGSLPRSRTYSPVGRHLFQVARDMALLFQHGTVDGDLPGRFHDPEGYHLGWSIDLPQCRLIAPDLRSERTRRQIMGPGGWAMMEQLAQSPAKKRVLMMSSVPLLGPRLSILESLMIVIPKMQHYEDDLRDQWQSRAHRDEWRRMLRLLQEVANKDSAEITVISGEIHLATRATMELQPGQHLHQLVASGVTHRAPPKAWARFLGALSWLGEDPLPKNRILIHPIPGQSHRYIAERNTMSLQRKDGKWSAQWHFEKLGRTDLLKL